MDTLSYAHLCQVVRGQHAALVEGWYRIITRMPLEPHNDHTLRQNLGQLADQAIALLFADPFVPDAARSIGSAFVGLGNTQPETLEEILIIFDQQVWTSLSENISADLQRRLRRIIVSIATGFTIQIHANLRAEQDIRQQELWETHQRLERDMAERAAALSQANAEILRANRLRDNFLANVSHELRTPLNAILGLSGALRDEVYGLITEKQGAILQQIETSGQRLHSLISDMLDLARINAGKVQLEQHLVNIIELCQICLKRIEPSAQHKHLQIVTSFDMRTPNVLADGQRLKQILLHLLDNAIKFTPEDGSIGIETKGDEDQRSIRVTVWDTGIGIAEEDFAQLFQPFRQVDSSLTRSYSGTGLGLILVYYLTELHGGSVSVTSNPGQGSRFTISLPWHLDHHEAVGLDHTPISMIDRPVVLLAEDDLAVSDLLKKYLQRKGYQVVVAYNGAEAIEQALTVHPAVIIMDIQMPEVNGLEAIKRIRAEPTLTHTPVVAVTALAMPGDRERCLLAGANVYLSKPVSLHRLSETLEGLFHQVEE